jgi:aspartyl-tRNA(Asn)/glutamyl-tRNA(Gln) amidotransferase subunit C
VPLDPSDLDKLCQLAMLEITPTERADVAAKLSDIVRLVDELQSVDTGQALPMAHPLDRPQRLREDRVTERDERALYQRNAAMVEQDLYLVPRVIE